eukprot:NODE_5750_length_490_cov_82.303855_g4302_i0.p4 GENE.NODE_5750_length_490_cov_82.303855_g4302_i0~~NODE_5750_length_490_cov_82.303855_g4302_i0.p4  ORF type:complete len:79 (-),score=35.30 NODE_5750_length_490_cov_82.303855_g4302_i0:253-462(-)
MGAAVTISRGQVVWENGQLHVTQGAGKYVPRPAFGCVFDSVAARDSARALEKRKVEREPYTGPVFVPGH